MRRANGNAGTRNLFHDWRGRFRKIKWWGTPRFDHSRSDSVAKPATPTANSFASSHINRYAHIHDATMREKLSDYLQGTLVDVTGKVVPEEGPLDTGDLRWFTRNVLAQALPNGYCAIPVVAGPCPHPNACLNCAHFRTDARFLDVHKAELRDTERVITKANANGWTRQIEMNERKRNNLVSIVTSLERTHA